MAIMGRLDDVAEMLEATGRFRCLKRVPDLESSAMPEPPPAVRIGVIVDVEATGPDARFDHPIEIAAVKVAYVEGRIAAVVGTIEMLAEPPSPLSEDVKALVGLADADLAGRRFDVDALNAFVADANVCLSHNAHYDRGILERRIPGFPVRPWACSLADIPWKAEGVMERRLGDLLARDGFFADGHRAMVDCVSLCHLLRRPLPLSGIEAFEAMLRFAREPTATFFAERAPFSGSAAMKARGYRWLDGRGGEPRCWSTTVPFERAGAEAVFLFDEVYGHGGARPTWLVVDAMHRYRPLEVIAAGRVPVPSLEEARSSSDVTGDAP